MFCTSCGQPINDKATLCVHCGVPCGVEKKFCATCGKPVFENQAICLNCGCALPPQGGVAQGQAAGGTSSKDWTTTLLLCLFTGGIGGHQFYVGSPKKGILILVLQIITCGVAGSIWALVDLISICTKKFTDGQGNVIR